MLKAVLFDLDETLILRSGAIRAFIHDQYRRFAARLGGLAEDTYAERFLEVEKNGVIGKDVAYPELVSVLGITGVGAGELLEDYRQNYAHFASPSPGAVETVRDLHEQGFRTGIVSNGNVQVQESKIDAIGLRPVLDTVVISEAVGLRKPDAAIFALAAANLGIMPADCLFVGDNPEVDIVGAANAGLETAWFRNPPAWPPGLLPRATVEIDRMPEVLAFVGG